MVAHISFILEPPFEIGLIVAEVCDWYVKLNGPDLLGDGPDGRTAGHANIWKSKVLHLWQNAGHLEPIRLAMQSTKCCPTFPIGCLGSSAMAMRHELYACSRFNRAQLAAKFSPAPAQMVKSPSPACKDGKVVLKVRMTPKPTQIKKKSIGKGKSFDFNANPLAY